MNPTPATPENAQEVIDAALPGEEIQLAPGVYPPLTVRASNIAIRGPAQIGEEPAPPRAFKTTIYDCDHTHLVCDPPPFEPAEALILLPWMGVRLPVDGDLNIVGAARRPYYFHGEWDHTNIKPGLDVILYGREESYPQALLLEGCEDVLISNLTVYSGWDIPPFGARSVDNGWIKDAQRAGDPFGWAPHPRTATGDEAYLPEAGVELAACTGCRVERITVYSRGTGMACLRGRENSISGCAIRSGCAGVVFTGHGRANDLDITPGYAMPGSVGFSVAEGDVHAKGVHVTGAPWSGIKAGARRKKRLGVSRFLFEKCTADCGHLLGDGGAFYFGGPVKGTVRDCVAGPIKAQEGLHNSGFYLDLAVGDVLFERCSVHDIERGQAWRWYPSQKMLGRFVDCGDPKGTGRIWHG